jgi:hypothetical protein
MGIALRTAVAVFAIHSAVGKTVGIVTFIVPVIRVGSSVAAADLQVMHSVRRVTAVVDASRQMMRLPERQALAR